MKDSLDGKIVVVTGATGGIGAAETAALLEDGAIVHAIDQVPRDDGAWARLEATAPSKERLLCHVADVTSPELWDGLAREFFASGIRPHGLVNNAGITLRKTVTRTEPDEWQRVMSVNVTAAYLAIRALAPAMSDGGSIVSMSSSAGLTGYFGAAYGTSKWALRGLTKAAAIELAPRRIRVNAVCPGLVDTSMTMTADPDVASGATTLYDELKAATPFDRGAAPGEIADVVRYLLGSASSFITGTEIAVDGGMLGGGLYGRAARGLGIL